MSPPTPPGELDGGRAPRACASCARAKVKCDIDADNPVCSRCRRLKRVCTGQAPGMHRRNKAGRISDVARLEQKLDGVAAILATSERIGVSSISPQPSISNAALLSPIACVQQLIKDDEATLILDTFRTEMALYCPFVTISPEQTVDDLKQLKPFLYMTIMTVGCRHDIPRQTALARKVKELISQKMLLHGERNLDLLQGLLVFLAWYHIHIKSSQLSNLTCLMMALVIDLGLNKAVSPRHVPALGSIGYFGAGDRQGPIGRTFEERRAFLGGLYLTTGVSIWAREMDPIRYTKYADECCRVLEQANEYPSDQHLVLLIRMMRMVGRIRSTFSPEEWEPSSAMSAPVGACVRTLEAELEQLKSRLPTGTHIADILSLHYSFIKVFLYEIAVSDTIASSSYGSFPMTRLKMLFTCLDETKRFFDKFYTIPTTHYFNFTYFIWALGGHMCVVLSKLCIFAGDGWDPNYARSTFDFSTMVDMMLMGLSEAKSLASQSMRQTAQERTSLPFSIPELFTAFESKLRQWRELHMYRAAQPRPHLQATMPSSSGADALPTATLSDEFLNPCGASLFDLLDGEYWPQLI